MAIEREHEYFTPLHHQIAELLGYKQTPHYASWDKVEQTAPVQVIDRVAYFVRTNYTPKPAVPGDGELELLDFIDSWYHKNTRYHLVDVDPDVMGNLIKPLTSQATAAQERAWQKGYETGCNEKTEETPHG